MAIEIKVPRLGWSMEEGTFIEWLKHDGQPVRAGEPLFAIEGDKAIQEVESIGNGILRISPRAPENGETVKVGALLAFLAEADETVTFDNLAGTPAAPVARRIASPSSDAAGDGGEAAGNASCVSESESAARPAEKRRSSPRARRAAARLGIDGSQIQGTGRTGRIRERDVCARSDRLRSETREPASGASAAARALRRTIAARMVEGSRATAPV